jgi:hypothetical protein
MLAVRSNMQNGSCSLVVSILGSHPDTSLPNSITPRMRRYVCSGKSLTWRKTAWEVALRAEGSGFDSCPPHGAFLWGNGIVIVRLAEWLVPLWGLSEG